MGRYRIYRDTDDTGLGDTMAKYKYNGDQDLYFPSLGLTVKSGDVFDAPDDLSCYGVTPVTSSKSTPSSDDSSSESSN